MIKFEQKQYTEYDAMRALYVELMRYSDKNKFEVIDRSALIPVLRGNNVVIERFVISTSLFGKDKYRMYLKIGAKAKLPDEVRLAGQRVYDKNLLNFSIELKGGVKPRMFGKKGGGGNNNNNQNQGGGFGQISTGIKSDYQFFTIKQEVRELLGEALKYDKKDRSLVLEFNDIPSAIRALNILPFGLDYKIKLLND